MDERERKAQTANPSTEAASRSPGAQRSDSWQGDSNQAGATGSTEEVTGAIQDLKHDCLRLSTYHQYRRTYLDRWHRITAFSVIFFGTAAFATLVTKPGLSQWLVALPVLAGTFDLVFQFPLRARDHEFMYRRFVALLGDVSSEPDPDAAKVAHWNLELHRIYADAPPSHFKALDTWCHNLVCDHLDVPDQKLQIPWRHRLLKNVLMFTGASYPRVSQKIGNAE